MSLSFNINGKNFEGVIDLSDSLPILSSMKTYNVRYTKSTLIDILSGCFSEGDFIIMDKNVHDIYVKYDITITKRNIYLYDALEKNKDMKNVLDIIDVLYDRQITRNNKLIIVGGGITQDVGGFVASMYKRGLDWVFIPTTILSMTDSCIGGKVNVNHRSKNMLGFFNAPNEVIISDLFLKTLQKDDVLSGIGEALKLCLIGGHDSYKQFKEFWEKKDYLSIIKLASLVKKVVIEHDEYEKNERKVLNYGHTCGHAIESATKYKIPHGIAVLIGMYVKNRLFYGDDHKEVNELILTMINCDFLKIPFDYDCYFEHLLLDKKNRGNQICFVLLESIGKSVFVYKTKDETYNSMRFIFQEIFEMVL